MFVLWHTRRSLLNTDLLHDAQQETSRGLVPLRVVSIALRNLFRLLAVVLASIVFMVLCRPLDSPAGFPCWIPRWTVRNSWR